MIQEIVGEMGELSKTILDRQKGLAAWQNDLARCKQSLSELELQAALYSQSAPGATSDTKRKLAHDSWLEQNPAYQELLEKKLDMMQNVAEKLADMEHSQRLFRIQELQAKAMIVGSDNLD